MSSVSIDDIKQDLPAFLKRIASGEEFEITEGGRVVAAVKPVSLTIRSKRPFGLAAGAFEVPADFDAPMVIK